MTPTHAPFREPILGSALVGLLVLFGSGCLLPLAGLTQRDLLRTELGEIEVAVPPGAHREEKQARAAIKTAIKGLRQWGTFDQRVTFYVMPSHLHLESAVWRFGYTWLRAWARYDEVYFQAPVTWGGKPSEADVNELVLHELTHCLMYQRAATSSTWADKQIPLWFREGMATWTANQGYKFPSLEELARFYEKNPGLDPIGNPEPLYKDHNGAVYAAAHHAFTFFVRRYGKQSAHRLLDGMREGRTFPEAFLAATGITTAAFELELRHYVVWRGFKGAGQPKPKLFPIPP